MRAACDYGPETRAEMLRQMSDPASQLASVTERLTGAAAALGDRAMAEVEIESDRKAADQRRGGPGAR